jgi:hypothetical protein
VTIALVTTRHTTIGVLERRSTTGKMLRFSRVGVDIAGMPGRSWRSHEKAQRRSARSHAPAVAAIVLKNDCSGAMEHEISIRYSQRARRYPIRLTMRFRSSGDAKWRDARTENISRSGVLFRTADVMPRATHIEMLMALPAEVGGENATVICRGRIVRTEPPRDDDPQPAVAATIAGYRFVHAQGSDPRRI